MRLRAHCLHLAILVYTAGAAHADDGLTQTTISIHAGGKPVGGLMFPIGAKVKTSAVASRIDTGDMQIRYAGNVQGRITVSAGEVILFGDELVFSSEAISAERHRTVRDLDASGDPLRFDPIEDEAHVDERRRSIGLEPLAEYAKRFGLTYTPKGRQ